MAGVDDDLADLKTFPPLSGFIVGFAAILSGFGLGALEGADVVAVVAVVVDADVNADADGDPGFLKPKESLTGASPSCRCRPTASFVSPGETDVDVEAEADGSGPDSAVARAICSAMSARSRCSSETVARSFFCAASYIKV